MSAEHAGLTWNFQVNPDSCDNPEHYEQYIKFCAVADQKSGRGTTYVLLESNDKTTEKSIIGFITLKASSLIFHCADYDQGHAALEITELAIDKNYERQGIGKDLVHAAVVIANELNNDSIGIEYVTLCADPAAIKFYLNLDIDFEKLRIDYTLPYEDWNIHCIPLAAKLYN